MGTKYTEIDNFLWTNLRCGLAHQLKPKGKITLTSYQSKAIDVVHLYKGDKSGLTYIVVDTLFKDFKIACEKVIEILKDTSNTEIEIGKKTVNHLTVRNTRLEVHSDTGEIYEIEE